MMISTVGADPNKNVKIISVVKPIPRVSIIDNTAKMMNKQTNITIYIITYVITEINNLNTNFHSKMHI